MINDVAAFLASILLLHFKFCQLCVATHATIFARIHTHMHTYTYTHASTCAHTLLSTMANEAEVGNGFIAAVGDKIEIKRHDAKESEINEAANRQAERKRRIRREQGARVHARGGQLDQQQTRLILCRRMRCLC